MLAGCAKDAPQDTWKPEGANAQRIQNLQWPVFLVAGIVGVIVFAVIVFVVIRFRDHGQEMPEQTHGKPALEIALTILPALILVGVGIPTVSTVFELAKTSDTECVVNVTGQQWWWEYDYPAQTAAVDRDHRAASSPAASSSCRPRRRCCCASPAATSSTRSGSRSSTASATPCRAVCTLRMEADQPGIYAGQCTEFCGLSHANMRMEAVALTADDFETWVANQLQPASKPTNAPWPRRRRHVHAPTARAATRSTG